MILGLIVNLISENSHSSFFMNNFGISSKEAAYKDNIAPH